MTNQRGFINPLLLNPWALAAMAASLAIYSFYLYNKGYNNGYQHYIEFRANVEAEQEQIRIDTERKLKQLADLQKRTEDNWRIALDSLRNRPIRVQPGRCSGTLPAVSAATGAADAATAQLIISTGECEAIANNAVIDAAQVIHLQHWINMQREASK